VAWLIIAHDLWEKPGPALAWVIILVGAVESKR
jgi:hypothetical protein